MSNSQGSNTGGITQLISVHDTIKSRRISDNFSSSHSYAPECKCKKDGYETHLPNYEEKVGNVQNTLIYHKDSFTLTSSFPYTGKRKRNS